MVRIRGIGQALGVLVVTGLGVFFTLILLPRVVVGISPAALVVIAFFAAYIIAAIAILYP
jgi:hypothetical protein